MYATELFEQNKPRVVVTYPGRFQPFHQGHAGVFAQLQKKFGAENVFVLTSNDTSSAKSPFNFSDKYQLIAAAGVPANHIVETNRMYILPDGFDPSTTVFVTAVGAPDKDRLNPDTFTKRDQKDKDGNITKPAGSASYYKTWGVDQTPVTADQHGYVVVIPEIQKNVTINGKTYDASHGTEVRQLWNMVRNDPAARAEFLKQLYKHAHQDLISIFNKIPEAVNESTVNEFAPGNGSIKPPKVPRTPKDDPWGNDDRSKLLQTVRQLLSAGNKIDWKVMGQMGHVVRVTPDSVILKRWGKPYSKINYSLMLDDTDDDNYIIRPVGPKHYKVVSSDTEWQLDEGWKEKVAGGALALGALGGIGALQNIAPNTTYKGHQLQLANPGTVPGDAKIVTDDNGKKIYAWKTTGVKNRSQWVYRPVEEVKEGFDREAFRRHMADLEAREELRKTDPVAAKALDLRGELKQTPKKKPEDDSIGINDPRHPGYAYTQMGQPNIDEAKWACPFKKGQKILLVKQGIIAVVDGIDNNWQTISIKTQDGRRATVDSSQFGQIKAYNGPVLPSSVTTEIAELLKNGISPEEVANTMRVPVEVVAEFMSNQGNEQLDEFAPDEGGGGRKFIPWPEFIDAVKQIVGKDFDVVEKVVKSTIQDRFVPHDPMSFGPTMLYSYYEARAGRGKGAVSTRGSIQVGKYVPNNSKLGTQNYITTFNLLKGHKFERHFDLTFDNIYEIANIIKGNTEGAYQMQPQGVAESSSGMFSKILTHETSPENAKLIKQNGFKMSYEGVFFNAEGANYSGGGYGGVNIKAQITGDAGDILDLEDDDNLPDDLEEFDDAEGIARYAREQGYWAWTDGMQFVVLEPGHIKLVEQGVAESSTGVSVKKWANQVRKDHGADIKFVNRKEGGGAVDSVIAKNSQGETVGVYNRKTGYPTVYEPKQKVAEGACDDTVKKVAQVAALYAQSKNLQSMFTIDEYIYKKLGIKPNMNEEFTSKQDVINHFVKQGKSAAAGATAWERGWRGPKSKAPATQAPKSAKPQQRYWWQEKDLDEDAAGVGVVAKNRKMAKDPRYSMSITKDVKPSTPKNMLRAFRLSETWAARRQIAEGNSKGIDKTAMMKVVKKFLPLAMQELKVNKLPRIVIRPTLEADDGQATFGRFDNDKECVYLAIANRHPVDVLRTLAHELVHYKQYEQGKMYPGAGETGSPIENQAHVVAGIIMRHFNKKYPNAINLNSIDVAEDEATDKTDTSDIENALGIAANFSPPLRTAMALRNIYNAATTKDAAGAASGVAGLVPGGLAVQKAIDVGTVLKDINSPD